jgi:hypothetical protein
VFTGLKPDFSKGQIGSRLRVRFKVLIKVCIKDLIVDSVKRFHG